MLCAPDTPIDTVVFTSFFFRKSRPILFPAQIKAIQMLHGSNHPDRTFVLGDLRIFRDFGHFNVHKASMHATCYVLFHKAWFNKAFANLD